MTTTTIEEITESLECPLGSSDRSVSTTPLVSYSERPQATFLRPLEASVSSSSTSSSSTEILAEISRNPRIRTREVFEGTPGSSSQPRPQLIQPPLKRRRTNDLLPPITNHSSGSSFRSTYSDDLAIAEDDVETMRLTQSGEPSDGRSLSSEPHRVTSGLSPTLLPIASGAPRATHTDQGTAIHVEPFASGTLSNMMNTVDDSFAPVKNGHVKALSNGSTNGSVTNGSLSPRLEVSNEKVSRFSTSITRVEPPGTTLYSDSNTNREEFVRLVLQTLKDIGYVETASTLELESGFSFETSHVAAFRRSVIIGDWDSAWKGISNLGVQEEDSLRAARFLISQQKYLELLEAGRSTDALIALRQEISLMDIEPERLHRLTSLMMSRSPDELRRSASWDGAKGTSRHKLLSRLQQFIPSSTMVPARRLDTLLNQAREHQVASCTYHVGTPESSLYHDHVCSRNQFPSITSHILAGHTDEVWQVQWSHSGKRLASASKDHTVIIWRIAQTSNLVELDCSLEKVLDDHEFSVTAIAWSPDDKLLLSSAHHEVKLWDVETGTRITVMEGHSHTVNGLCWMADGESFISGGMDRKIIHWNLDGSMLSTWPTLDIRIQDLAITPDKGRLVAIGYHASSTPNENPSTPLTHAILLQASAGTHPPIIAGIGNSNEMERRIIVYDSLTKQEIWSQTLWGELQSVKISEDSRFALVNHVGGDVMLWDLEEARLVQRFFGRPRGKWVVRNCFGGRNANFILSGSEDGHIYVWQRRTGTLFEVLTGHNPGGVNSVDWCPNDVAMFASCGDDGTVRIWRPEQNLTPSMLSESQNGHIRNFSNGNLDSGSSNGILRSREVPLQAPPGRARESPAG